MKSGDIKQLVDEKTNQLSARSPVAIRAAQAALLKRTYALATEARTRWPDQYHPVTEATTAALGRLTEATPDSTHADVTDVLEAFDIEDDGSAEWQRTLDLIAMLLAILHDTPAIDAIRDAMQTHLEGTYNIVANAHADAAGHPISETTALSLMDTDQTWQQEAAFVLGL
jgi:hypothetical protein